jgi:hypothetical protein
MNRFRHTPSSLLRQLSAWVVLALPEQDILGVGHIPLETEAVTLTEKAPVCPGATDKWQSHLQPEE